jgi:hypothetical protein
MNKAPITATKTGHVNGRKICVYDDLLPAVELKKMSDGFNNSGFTRSESARPDTRQFRHWVVNIPVDAARQMPIFNATLAAVADYAPGTSWNMYRSYCNYASYGDMLFTHTDCLPESEELTALWYICTEWELEWGGETLFYNDDGDADFVASPRPGRLVVFHGAIRHAGRPPSKICVAPRYTFAMKLEPAAA